MRTPTILTLAGMLCFGGMVPIVTQEPGPEVIVSAGLELVVTPAQDIYSNTVVVNERVELVVVDDVRVAGRLVIARGSRARARVAVAKPPAGFGRNGELLIELIDVTAVDGSSIALLGEQRVGGTTNRTGTVLLWILAGPIGGRFHEGAPGRLTAGVRLKATTERATLIRVKP